MVVIEEIETTEVQKVENENASNGDKSVEGCDISKETDEKTDHIIQENDKQTTPKAHQAPQAPPAPEMKLSQIVPMLVMLGLQKFDIEQMGYIRYAEMAFAISQLLCFGLLFMIYSNINKMPADGKKIHIPEVKQLGQVVSPAMEQTPKAYDMAKWMEQTKQAGMSCVMLGFFYYKWGYVMPLVLQIVMTPLQLSESPLFQLHFIGKEVARPFPTPNLFGLPSAPSLPVETEKKQQ